MSNQQTNPESFTRLNDDTDEARHRARFSFDQRGSEEEIGKSGARHRGQAPNSGSTTQDETESSNQDKPQPKRKELSTVFSLFYGTGLVIYIWRNGNHLLYWIDSLSQGRGLDIFAFFGAGWGFVLCLIAFEGLQNKKNLKTIERAYTMVKIDGALVVISLLGKVSDTTALKRMDRSRYLISSFEVLIEGTAVLVFWFLFVFLPTRNVRNTWRTVITPEEEARQEEQRKMGHFERMYSSNFIVLKYVPLLYFFVFVPFFAWYSYLEASDQQFWKQIKAERSFVISTVYGYILSPSVGAIFFLQFEGLRRKNLNKIVTSIKLMKIWLVAGVLVQFPRDLVLYYEGKLSEEYFNDFSLDNDNFFVSLLIGAIFGVWGGAHLWYISKVRDTMKKTRHTL